VTDTVTYWRYWSFLENRIYFFLISKTGHDPMIVELMKLSALADVQKRYDTGEPWLLDN
jgi:hypothetical protein